MFRIDLIKFHPVPEDTDFVIHLLTPSNEAKLEAMAKMDGVSFEGPKSETDKKLIDSKKLLSMNAYREVLLKYCIKKIEGLEIGGVKIESAEQFISAAPDYLLEPVGNKIQDLMEVPEDLKKK